MTPGTVFVSHRSEYAPLVRELKKAIETTSRGNIKVFTSEDLSGAKDWRAAIKSQLREAESLFLVYGAAYEDWSWCFYEAGFFAGSDVANIEPRKIYCIARPNVPAPGPLSDLQMVTDKDRLIDDIIEIYERNKVDYNPIKLRESINQAAAGLFRKLHDFVNYSRVYFEAKDTEFTDRDELPAGAVIKGESAVLSQLFGIGGDAVAWSDITKAETGVRTPQERMFFCKWAEETKKIILAARENRFIAPQTVLIVRGGLRYRLLLLQARVQGDGRYLCEFLAVDDVGGPPLGLSRQLLALLTSIRMGFRFRYELIKHFADDSLEMSDEDRRARIEEIPRILDNLMTESESRGNIAPQDLQAGFSEYEADRIGKLLNYWPLLKDHLYSSLGLSKDGKLISDRGLVGSNLEKYRIAFESLQILNTEFLSRCCAQVSRMMLRSEEELKKNAETLESNVRKLRQM